MLRQLFHDLIEDEAVDQPDKAKLLDDGHEFLGVDDPPVRRAHAQQALVMVDFLGRRLDHRLEGKYDAVLPQRRADLFADRQTVPLALALLRVIR